MSVRSNVELDINAPRAKVAALFADPGNNTKGMDDVARTEPISGEPGMPGSKYRMVPKKGDREFVATVVARNLPDQSRLKLDGSTVAVAITDTFLATGPGSTRILSEEVFTFKGFIHKVFGVFAQGAIRKAHRRHIEAFKRFAEAGG